MKICEVILLILFIVICLCPLLIGKVKVLSTSPDKKFSINELTTQSSSDSILPDVRWDYHILEKDAEKADVIESLMQLGKKITQESTPLKWVLNESPASLTVFAIYCCSTPEDDERDPTYAFWKFMNKPGTEIILTEASYRGYLPAMSILASLYENEEDTDAADYWQKFGVAHLNPTSIMLRGLKLTINGKLINNNELADQGTKLITLSYMLGEESASLIPGFENLVSASPFDSYIKEDILEAIYEIENINKDNILKFLTEIKEIISCEQARATDFIDILKKINHILDNPNVTVMEIAVLLPLRNTIIETLNNSLEDNVEFLESLTEAELMWKYKRVAPDSDFVSEIIIPMIIGTNKD